MALPKLIVVLGPTACGKSGLGVGLAKHLGGEIISADSRQVYRGLDLGTGKVTEEEMDGVPHHLLDVVEPNQSYSVAEFQRDAYAAIDEVIAREKPPILVGGTGLYVRAVAQGYTFPAATPNPELRAQLEAKSVEELYGLFQAQTGRTLTDGEDRNHQRLVRTLEKVLQGDSLAEAPRAPRYHVLHLGITYPRAVLCERIDQRLQKRIEDGMIDEVALLRQQGATDAFLDGLGLEYRYILRYLKGEYQMDELVDELGRAIKRFAKRQTVWFKKDRDVLWLDVERDPLAQAIQAAEAFGR